MRKLITMLVVFAACLSTTASVQAGEKDSKVNGWSGHRTIIPYPPFTPPPHQPLFQILTDFTFCHIFILDLMIGAVSEPTLV